MITTLGLRLALLVFLYVSLAPFAMILESTDAIGALRSAIRYARGNWLWLCAGTILFWLVRWGIGRAMTPIPAGPWLVPIRTIVFALTTPFMTAGVALQYVNLALRAGAAPRPDAAGATQPSPGA